MPEADELFDLLVAVIDPLDLELVDVELRNSVARVVVDREGGVNLDMIAQATQLVSGLLEDHDPYPGHHYTLEVTSPGVERPLRTPRHFTRAIGEVVSVRTMPGTDGDRRVQGKLLAADAGGIVLEDVAAPTGERRVSYDEIERARTVFEWGGEPRPTGGTRRGTTGQRAMRPLIGDDREKVTTP